jgi:2-hydroxychromene-2-carboxylate isomerase
MTVQERWYFSLRSPYSWFAYRELVERHPEVADTIEWIPFWEPDELIQKLLAERKVELPIVPMSRAKNFYILQDTRRLAVARGLTMTWPADRNPHWEPAHLGYLVAAAAGRGRDFVDAVYRARWEQGRDITERATIGEIAAELGLGERAVADAADDPAVREEGVECLARSYRDGLFGVPFFVRGRDKYFGLDRLRAFVAAGQGEPAPEAATWLDDAIDIRSDDRPGGDGIHAGGCG